MMSMFQAFRQLGIWSGERSDNLLDGGAPFYRSYETSDGRYVAVGALEPQFYANLIAALGLTGEDLPAQMDRGAWPAMRERFAAIFRTRSRDEWVAATAGRDACVSPVLDLDEAPGHPHLSARETYADFAEARHPSPAPRFDRTPAELRRPAPAAGEHSLEALAEWGVSEEEIAALQACGAMRQA
jgi:alpha-methylacyl-CoA racemase